MNQKKLPEVWHLQKGNKIEINGEEFTILEVQILESYHKGHPDYKIEKTFELSNDYFLSFEENGINLHFGKIKKPKPNTFDYSDNIKIESIKIIKI